MTSSTERSGGGYDREAIQSTIRDTERLCEQTPSFTFASMRNSSVRSRVKQSWAQRHPDACRRMKYAAITALVIGLLVGAGLIAMHFTVGVNSAGFQKLWTAFTTQHQFTTGQVLLYGVVPVLGTAATIGILYKLVICIRTRHSNKGRIDFSQLRLRNDERPFVDPSHTGEARSSRPHNPSATFVFADSGEHDEEVVVVPIVRDADTHRSRMNARVGIEHRSAPLPPAHTDSGGSSGEEGVDLFGEDNGFDTWIDTVQQAPRERTDVLGTASRPIHTTGNLFGSGSSDDGLFG